MLFPWRFKGQRAAEISPWRRPTGRLYSGTAPRRETGFVRCSYRHGAVV